MRTKPRLTALVAHEHRSHASVEPQEHPAPVLDRVLAADLIELLAQILVADLERYPPGQLPQIDLDAVLPEGYQ